MRKWLRSLWISLLSGTALLTACGVRPAPTLYGPPPEDSAEIRQNNRRQALQQRLDSIRDIIEQRENAKVYGSPEVIRRYRSETNRLRAEADSLNKEIEMIGKQIDMID